MSQGKEREKEKKKKSKSKKDVLLLNNKYTKVIASVQRALGPILSIIILIVKELMYFVHVSKKEQQQKNFKIS